MFPRFHELHKNTPPDVYFGGDEPPTYTQYPIRVNATIQEIAQTIYDLALNKHVCGFITEGALNYFVDERGKIQVDDSKDFIFFADRLAEEFEHPTPFGILRFLQDECDKGIFICNGSAYYIEKTPQTYQLCVELDDIWDENEFFERIEEIIDTEDHDKLNMLLSVLMKEYELRITGSMSPLWNFTKENKDQIMEEKLFLNVERFIVEEE